MFVQMTQSSSSSSYSSYSSSSSKTVKSSSSVTQSSMTSSHSSSNVSIRSGGSTFADKYGKDLGIDVDSKMAELTAKMDAEFDKVRKDFFNLSILERSGSGISDLIKLDNKAIMEFVDEKDKDKVKFNFDVDEDDGYGEGGDAGSVMIDVDDYNPTDDDDTGVPRIL